VHGKESIHAATIARAKFAHIEMNFLLNPLHPEFTKIRIGSTETFAYVSRLIKKYGRVVASVTSAQSPLS
jgi:hypothetical protein